MGSQQERPGRRGDRKVAFETPPVSASVEPAGVRAVPRSVTLASVFMVFSIVIKIHISA